MSATEKPLATFLKDPDADLDFTLDWTAWLGADTITASEWILPTGIMQSTATFTSHTATVWLTGGTAGTTYRVTNRITTDDERIDDRSLAITVSDR